MNLKCKDNIKEIIVNYTIYIRKNLTGKLYFLLRGSPRMGNFDYRNCNAISVENNTGVDQTVQVGILICTTASAYV